MVQISLAYVITKDKKVNTDLEQNYTCMLLSVQCEYKLRFSGWDRKNTFTKPMATYHGSEVLLIFSSKDSTSCIVDAIETNTWLGCSNLYSFSMICLVSSVVRLVN